MWARLAAMSNKLLPAASKLVSTVAPASSTLGVQRRTLQLVPPIRKGLASWQGASCGYCLPQQNSRHISVAAVPSPLLQEEEEQQQRQAPSPLVTAAPIPHTPVQPELGEPSGNILRTNAAAAEVERQSEDYEEELDWSAADLMDETEREPGKYPRRPMKLWPEKKRPGKKAVISPMPKFEEMLSRLLAYKEAHGDCSVPKRFWDDPELGDWASRIRDQLRLKKLPERHFHELDAIGFPWSVPMEVAEWNFLYHELRRYRELHGDLGVPFKWRDPTGDFSNVFAKWFHAQPTLFLQRRLSVGQIKKLLSVGYDLRQVTGDAVSKADYHAEQSKIGKDSARGEFDLMFDELKAWKATYYTTVVPRMVYDNPVLGMWAHKVRKDQRNERLPQWQVDKLDAIQFAWKVDQITAKWHHNLHEARRYKEIHGSAMIPEDYANPAEPGFVEASRWIQRQAKMFRKQKLTDKRYRIIREVLGIKFVRQYAPNMRRKTEMKPQEQGAGRRRFVRRRGKGLAQAIQPGTPSALA